MSKDIISNSGNNTESVKYDYLPEKEANKIQRKINTIFIANRSEVAVRITETAHKMGIKVVVAYSDIDTDSVFVNMADVAVHIDGKLASETYLDTEKLIKICKEHNVDAVHPGYGFLSENTDFARRVESEGMIFIGPSPYSIDAMGDKLKAKLVAEKSKVPLVPGCKEVIKTAEQAKVEAEKIGYPVLMKAVAGGGGKGMAIVRSSAEIADQFESIKHIAKTIFKNEDILIEKFVENPRHIEIQIVADRFGNCVCLGERECSIQRFNQKVIEEAPSPFVDKKMREKMYECSKNLVKECKYYSVGTLEYIVDSNKNFYFMEMNTRLQVEHTVSEFITGLDFVELMINIAEGKKLPFTQKDIKLRGHGLECRICAENPAKNFMPSNGQIIHYYEPEVEGRNDVKIETGVQLGSEISPYYDSMIAKVITHDFTRENNIKKMRQIISQYEIDGVETNITFLESILRQPDFENGNLTTGFIKNHYPHGFNALPLNNDATKAFVASGLVLYLLDNKDGFSKNRVSYIPRDTGIKNVYVVVDDKSFLVQISSFEDREDTSYLEFEYNEQNIRMTFNYNPKQQKMSIVFDGQNDFSVRIKNVQNTWLMNTCGLTASVGVYDASIYEYLKYMPPKPDKSKPQFLLAPMTGKLVKLLINEGDKVSAGQHILSIEAMKMENNIVADANATVKKIYCQKGDNVNSQDKLIEFEYKDE